MEGEERAHQRPAQAAPVNHGGVDLLGGGDIVVDEPQSLAPQSLHQPVGDEADDLLAHRERPHAERTIKSGGAVYCPRGGSLAADQLDQRQQVDGVERMADQHPLRPRHLRRQQGRQQAGGRGGDDGLRIGGVDAGEQLLLEFFTLRRIFLDEIGAGHTILKPLVKGQPRGARAGGHSAAGHRRPRGVDRRERLAAGVGGRVPCVDVEARAEEPRRPSRPDDARADNGDPFDFGTHDSPNLLLRRRLASAL